LAWTLFDLSQTILANACSSPQALRRQLHELLPDDCADTAGGCLTLCYQQVLPWPRACIVNEWSSKADLIDTVCASCNWPFFFSRWPLVKVRGSLALDGFFALPRGRFGCPDLPARRNVAVCALPSISLDFAPGDTIQPIAASDPMQPPSETSRFELPVGTAQWFSWACAGTSKVADSCYST